MNAIKKNIIRIILTQGIILFGITTVFAQAIREIKANVNAIAGNKSKVYNECIGAGRANEGLRADWQKQLAMIQKDVHFKYIRFHGLLHDDMRIYTEDKKTGAVIYNFQYVDKLYDYLLSIGIKPFVEFGFMPSELASGTKTIFLVESQCNQTQILRKMGRIDYQFGETLERALW